MSHVSNFLQSFIELSEDTEIPDSFAMWAGISAVSSVLGRNVWVNQGHYTIYPNTYILFVAPSGKFRKSSAIDLSTNIVESIEPEINFVAQKTSNEALIQGMRKGRGGANSVQVGEPEICEGYIVADELSTFLNRRSYDMGIGDTLIQFYDCRRRFKYTTLSRGDEYLRNVCANLLGGTTPTRLKTIFPEEALGDGLASRIIFVYVEKPKPPVAITRFSDYKQQLITGLRDRLQVLALMSGEMNPTPEGWSSYEEIYNRFYTTSDFYNNESLSGYASRRGVHLVKLAMIFSLVENTEMTILPRHFEGADLLLTEVEKFLPSMVRIVTTSDKGSLLKEVKNVIRTNDRIPQSALVGLMSHKCDTQELTSILQTLIVEGSIKQDVIGGKRYLVYLH